jgi:hypothetical protein
VRIRVEFWRPATFLALTALVALPASAASHPPKVHKPSKPPSQDAATPAPATTPAPVAAPVAPKAAAPTPPAAKPDATAEPQPAKRKPWGRNRVKGEPVAPTSAAPLAAPAKSSPSAPATVAVAVPRSHRAASPTAQFRGPLRDGAVRSFVSGVRRAFDITSLTPPVETLTTSTSAREHLKPLEDKLATMGPGVAPSVLAMAHADFANGLSMRGLDAAAVGEYALAIEIDRTFAPAWNNVAALLRRNEHRDLASKALDVVLELEPRNGLAWFNRALLAEDHGDIDAADDAYLRALELQPALWLPSQNPLVIGNRRAQFALLRNYMEHGNVHGVLLDPSPPMPPNTPTPAPNVTR